MHFKVREYARQEGEVPYHLRGQALLDSACLYTLHKMG
jgi:hypothetical protein